MAYKIYEEGFYNEYQKKRYINTQPESYHRMLTRILSRAKDIETHFNTDLYNFNLHQFELLFNYLDPSTLNASRTNFYNVLGYVRWGVIQDLRKNKLNPLEILGDADYLKKFVDHSRKKFFTKDEIDKMIASCVNPQDSVVVSLIFEGAFGSSNYDELLNLTDKSLKKNNILLLEDGDASREIEVSDQCYKLVKDALNIKYYQKKNGSISATSKAPDEAKITDNGYVLRNIETRNVHSEKANKFLIQRRVKAVKDYNSDWVRVLTPLNIRSSGMLYYAYQLYKKYGKLDRDEYGEICVKFGIKKVMNNGIEGHNFHRFKSDFLNLKKIKELYKV